VGEFFRIDLYGPVLLLDDDVMTDREAKLLVVSKH
jgi:hypothetical protein